MAEKTCDICLEVVMKKKPEAKRRFGILPNCNHTFCVECIKTWRSTVDYTDEVKNGCPTCRVQSKFYCQSRVWIEMKHEKKRLIAMNKSYLKKVDCRYYNRGAGVCPQGERCLYRHGS